MQDCPEIVHEDLVERELMVHGIEQGMGKLVTEGVTQFGIPKLVPQSDNMGCGVEDADRILRQFEPPPTDIRQNLDAHLMPVNLKPARDAELLIAIYSSHRWSPPSRSASRSHAARWAARAASTSPVSPDSLAAPSGTVVAAPALDRGQACERSRPARSRPRRSAAPSFACRSRSTPSRLAISALYAS